MTSSTLEIRTARLDELGALHTLMELAIGALLKPFLNEAEIASSRAIMGLDSQLMKDGTYFVVEENGALAGCGGWSRRATMYGGDVSPGRDPALLDPAKDAARVRAMYTHPAFVRRGVGRMILERCEDGGAGRRLHPRRAGRHHGRPAALPRLRLPAGGALHRRPRRDAGAAGPHGQGAVRGNLVSSPGSHS